MKLNIQRALALVVASVVTFSAHAAVLSKDAQAVKEFYDGKGATSCSKAMASIVNFVADGRPFAVNKQWASENTNKGTISVDFAILGTKKQYSRTGSIVMTPIGKQCVGGYVYSYSAPAPNCVEFFRTEGFTEPRWKVALKDENGDGGTAYFLEFKDSMAMNFIANDIAGGCNISKRETFSEPM